MRLRSAPGHRRKPDREEALRASEIPHKNKAMETGASPSKMARARLLDWLGEVGPRWGLPAAACRVHGYLYLAARPASVAELAKVVTMPESEVEDCLSWLRESALAEEVAPSLWRTGADPWELVATALEQRRARELAPALDVLRASRRDAVGDPILSRQVGKLLDLVEDIAAIDAQARRLSPRLIRGMLAAGGRAARLFGVAGEARR